MKLFGMCLILLSALAGARRYLGLRGERLRALDSLCRMLEQLLGELETRRAPLPEIAGALGPKSEGAAGHFLEELAARLALLGEVDFQTIWSGCAAQTLGALEEAERREVERLGAILGRYGLGRQCEAVRDCLTFLRGRRDQCEQELARRRGLAYGLAMSGGALLVIVLM